MIDTKDLTDVQKTIAEIRGDLIRRLFAIAISIGFSVAVVQADWVKAGRAPQGTEWHQITTVFIAMTATVLSWDGYLRSIKTKPLYDMPRFVIDVILVFSYLFLFATSSHDHFLTIIMLLCFSLYSIWDFLTFRMFFYLYGYSHFAKPSMLKAYADDISQKTGATSGVSITLLWTFLLLPLLVSHQMGVNHYLVCAILFTVLILYRKDKGTYVGDRRGFMQKNRLAMMGAIAAVVLLGLGSIQRL